jgi:cysteine desulfurase
MNKIYMDYAATTPTHPDVLEAMKPYFTEVFGNPSSIHSFGRDAKKAVDEARDNIAGFLNARSEEIFFTSGGTESDNFAIEGVMEANKKKGDHVISTPLEHHAVINKLADMEKKGYKVTFVPVNKEGLVDPQDIKKAITDKTVLVTVMHANNEIGTIEPIADIGAICREKGVFFHTDAVQTFGHMPIDVQKMNIDLMSASSHKLYGPKGVGLLYVKKGVRISPIMHGGEQERGKRGGTENVPGIVGSSKAVDIAKVEMSALDIKLAKLRDKLIDGLLSKIEDTTLNGHRTKRLSNNANISIGFIEGESILLNLDIEGIGASTGSACSSSSLEPSHVLLGLGCSHEQAHSSIRFSLGRWTTEEEVNRVLALLPNIVSKLRSMSPLYKKK